MKKLLTEARRTYRLLNHGPTTLITSAAGGKTNVMAAAWVMAIDFEPPKLAAVIAADTYTAELVRASRELTINLPIAAQAELTWLVGSSSGRDFDKFEKYGIRTSPGEKIAAPMIEGCAAWLECRLLPEEQIEQRHDLYIAEVLAAWYDDAVFDGKDWCFDDPSKRTIHHLSQGVFFMTGDRIDGKKR